MSDDPKPRKKKRATNRPDGTIVKALLNDHRFITHVQKAMGPLAAAESQFAGRYRDIWRVAQHHTEMVERLNAAHRSVLDLPKPVIELPRLAFEFPKPLIEVPRPIINFHYPAIDVPKPYWRSGSWAFAEEAAKVLEQITRTQKGFSSLDPALRDGMCAMAEAGWFMDEHMPITMVLSMSKRMENDPDGADSMLCEYFGKRLYSIEVQICKAYPERRSILAEAFGAHRSGYYSLTIPAFYQQADGIWEYRTSRSLFSNGGPSKAAQQYIANCESGESEVLYLSPLLSAAPLWQRKWERKSGFVGLNRHQIMHGESVDYPSEINSFKAISFLNYVYVVLRGERN